MECVCEVCLQTAVLTLSKAVSFSDSTVPEAACFSSPSQHHELACTHQSLMPCHNAMTLIFPALHAAVNAHKCTLLQKPCIRVFVCKHTSIIGFACWANAPRLCSALHTAATLRSGVRVPRSDRTKFHSTQRWFYV